MSLTKIGSIGINTGIAFAGVTTIATLNGSDAVLSVGGTVNFVSDVSIGGTVSIAGTLTYEDVTNVDAVGLITARDGIVVGSGITLSKDGDIFATGITTVSGNVKVGTGITLSPDGDVFATGVTTATTFSGSGASLTNLPAANITGTLPAISGANLTNLTAGNLTGALPAIDGSALTGVGGTDFIHAEQVSVSGIVTAQTFVPTVGQFSHRNLIINGAMQIAQYSGSSTSSGYQVIDRFPVYLNGADENPTVSHADVASGTTPYTLGFRTALKITNGNQTSGAGSNDYVWIQQKIEAHNIAQSGWNYLSSSSFITLSFWVKSSVAQTFKGYIETIDGTAHQYPFETGSLSANTWTKITKNIPGNSNLTFDNNKDEGFKLSIIPMMGTDKTANSVTEDAWSAYNSSARIKDVTTTWYTTNDATFELTGVQLEVGPVATPFEHRTFHDELQRCFRYFRKFGANNALPTPQPYNRFALGYSPTGGSSARFVIQLDPPMRINPLNAHLSTSGSFNTQPGNSGASSAITVDDNSCNVSSMTIFCGGLASVSTGDAISLLADNDTTAFIAISGEL